MKRLILTTFALLLAVAGAGCASPAPVPPVVPPEYTPAPAPYPTPPPIFSLTPKTVMPAPATPTPVKRTMTPKPTPAPTTTEQTALVVETGELRQLNLRLDAGERVNGKVTVFPQDINFIVKDPSGRTILNAGRITEKAFAFIAQDNGNYQLIFYIDSPTSISNRVVLVQVQHLWGGRFPYFAGTYMVINPGTTKTYDVVLSANQALKGSFKIQGGQQELRFSVRDPSGNAVVPVDSVYDSHTFVFTAATSGLHQLWFDNSPSPRAGKLVSLELFTNPTGQWQSWWGMPAKLIFTTSPAGATSGSAFTTHPVVTVQDGNGNTVTTSSAAVTVVITPVTGTSGAILSGTRTVSTVDGAAIFSGLSIDLAGTGYALTATSSGLFSTTSKFFNVLSKSVPPEQLKMFTLGVVVMPAKGGSVTLSPDNGTYIKDTTVTLTAVPASGYKFVSWGGNLVGPANPINIIMDSDKSVTAYFVPQGW